MCLITCVDEGSHNLPGIVDAINAGAERVRNIDNGKGAGSRAQEAVPSVDGESSRIDSDKNDAVAAVRWGKGPHCFPGIVDASDLSEDRGRDFNDGEGAGRGV